jgi:hypothetical protein
VFHPGQRRRALWRTLGAVNNPHLETTMHKLLTVIAAAFVACAAAVTGAKAGFNLPLKAPAGFSEVHKAGCGGRHIRAFRHRVARQSVRRPKRQVEVAKRTVSKPAVIAEVEPQAEPVEESAANAVESENSSISFAETVAEVEAAEKPELLAAEAKDDDLPRKVASSVKDVGCKTFFASVGMTLSVPCAK